MNKNPSDRVAFIEQVFAELQRIEMALPGAKSRGAGRYVNSGDWFMRPGFALACARRRLARPSHQPILAGASLKSLARLCGSYLRGARCRFDSRAEAVNIRQRFGGIHVIRSFYPFSREPATIKALMESPSGCPMLKAEIESRRIVAATGHLLAPRIIAEDFTDPCPFVIEELVVGRVAFRRKDHALLSQKLLPSLGKHYATYGVSRGPLSSWFDGHLRDQAEQAARLLPWDSTWQDRRLFMSALSRLADSGRELTRSFCHGDLSVGHVAVSDDGRIFLLDWEHAGVQPIAVDLAEIMRTRRPYDGDLYAECVRLLGDVSAPVQSTDLFSPPEQMFLVSLRRIIAWKEKYEACREVQGKDPMVGLRYEFDIANKFLDNLCC